MSIPDFDNCQKWLNYFKEKSIYKIWLVSPIIFLLIITFLWHSNNDLRIENKSIEDKVAPISELYPKLELSAAVANLVENYRVLKNEVSQDDEQRWREAAKFSYNGSKYPGGGCLSEYLCGLVGPTVGVNSKKELTYRCNESNYKIWQKAIMSEPDFPFAFYYLADCYQFSKRSNWIEYAQKSKGILIETTKFDQSQDSGQKRLLELVNQMMKTGDTP